jgi:hypothetical protein
MKVYTPIAYYNDAKDIIALFPNYIFKGDEADIVISHYEEGFGKPITIDGTVDPDSDYTKEEAEGCEDGVFTSDGRYFVMFTRGNYTLLKKNYEDHGFYIDIYKLTEIDEPYEDVSVHKLQEAYDKLKNIREEIDEILMELAPYVAQ